MPLRAAPGCPGGAGIVVAWAMAASLAPLMSKGKDWARTAHISFNVLAIGLFTWQLCAAAAAAPPRRAAPPPAHGPAALLAS